METGEKKGWNRSAANNAPPTQRVAKRGILFCLCVLAVLVGLAILCVWLLGGRSGTRTRRPAVAKPSKIADAKSATNSSHSKTNVAAKPPADPHAGMVLSSNGVWQPADRPWRPGRTKVHGVHTNRTRRAKGTVPYRDAAEQMLFAAFSTPLGTAPRPLPRLVGKDKEKLVAALINRNEATDEDSEDLRIGKEILQRAKDEMKKFLRDGGEPEEFFAHYHNVQQMAYLKRLDAMKEMRRIAREESDPELARAFKEKVNEQLRADGIMQIHTEISDNPEDN